MFREWTFGRRVESRTRPWRACAVLSVAATVHLSVNMIYKKWPLDGFCSCTPNVPRTPHDLLEIRSRDQDLMVPVRCPGMRRSYHCPERDSKPKPFKAKAIQSQSQHAGGPRNRHQHRPHLAKSQRAALKHLVPQFEANNKPLKKWSSVPVPCQPAALVCR